MLSVVRESALRRKVTKSKMSLLERVSEKEGRTTEDRVEEWEEEVCNPQYAAWILARRFPERWSERTRLQQIAEKEARGAVSWLMKMVSEESRADIARVVSGTRLEPIEASEAVGEIAGEQSISD